MKGMNSRLVSTYSNENEMAVMNSKGPALIASSKYALGHREVPHPVVHVLRIVQPVEVLVEVADGVELRLRMAQLVDRLHLAGHARAHAAQRSPGHRIAAVRRVFERRHAGQEQLQRVQVARVADVELAVVLLEGVDDRVELLFLLALELPVGVHREAERVFPLVPVVDLDALELVEGKDIVHRLVGGVPAEAAGHHRVAFLQAEPGGGALGVVCVGHGVVSLNAVMR